MSLSSLWFNAYSININFLFWFFWGPFVWVSRLSSKNLNTLKDYPLYIYPFVGISAREIYVKKIPIDYHFQHFQDIVVLILFKRCDSFLTWQLCSSSFSLFPLFIIAWRILSVPNSIFWLYILIKCIRVTNYFSYFAWNLIFSMF